MRSQSAGFTLMELLIVLLMSSWIISGLFTVYLHIKEHYLNNHAMQTMSEEINFVEVLLDHALQGAGYLGCSSWRYLQVYDNVHEYPVVYMDKPIIFWYAKDMHLPDSVRKKIKPDTQAIELKQMNFTLTHLAASAHPMDIEIIIENNSSLNWKNNDMIIIADCVHAELNRIVSMKKLSNQKTAIQLLQPLHDSYAAEGYVGTYLDRLYFINNTGQGLYVYNEKGSTEEISDVITDMRFWINDKFIETAAHGQAVSLSEIALLHTQMTLTLPYLIQQKKISKTVDFYAACRE